MSNDTEEEWFSFTEEAIITPMITASISCLCSLIIIITIIRSKQKSSPYHRILAFMSSWDVVVSTAIALVTIPMPQTLEEGYNYKGPHYGNKYTCAAQSFIILTGIFYIQSSSILLNIYYLCVIRFNIPDILFRKYAEPIYFGLSSLMSLPFMIFLLVKDELNPTPFEPFCGIGVYPDPCVTNKEIDCTISDNFGDYGSLSATFEKFLLYYLMGCIGTQCIALMISMGTILFTLYQYTNSEDGDRKELDVSSSTSEEATSEKDQQLLSRRQMKMVAAQAFAYIMALTLTYIFTLLSLFDSSNKTLAQLKMIFLPSQGLFNLLIFTCHKIYHYKHTVNSNIGNWDAIRLFFSRPDLFNDRYIVTNLDFVDTNVKVDSSKQERIGVVESSKNEHDLYDELDSKYALSLSTNGALSYGDFSGVTLPKDVTPLQSRVYSGVVFSQEPISNDQRAVAVGRGVYTLKEDFDDS